MKKTRDQNNKNKSPQQILKGKKRPQKPAPSNKFVLNTLYSQHNKIINDIKNIQKDLEPLGEKKEDVAHRSKQNAVLRQLTENKRKLSRKIQKKEKEGRREYP